MLQQDGQAEHLWRLVDNRAQQNDLTTVCCGMCATRHRPPMQGFHSELAAHARARRRVVGMHRFAGSWIDGKEEGRGIVNTTDELCNPQPDDVRRRRLQVW